MGGSWPRGNSGESPGLDGGIRGLLKRTSRDPHHGFLISGSADPPAGRGISVTFTILQEKA